jgi:S-(hydroxymethyl)glutathione dehydrogenase / alcohol dehydrogenase
VKAAVCHEFGKPLVVQEVTLAPPEADEVEVRVAACALCHSDISYMEGAWGGPLPAVYGHEAAGVVEAVGRGVERLEPGDHVVVSLVRSCGSCDLCVQGQPVLCEAVFPRDASSPLRSPEGREISQGLRTAAFAESVVVHASQAVAVPPDLPLDRACLLACGVATGFGAVVNTAQVRAGSSVVVVGAGGVGLNCVQAAALVGVGPLVAVDPQERKLELAEQFGATHTLDPSNENPVELVRGLTEGRGADYVFVAVGAKTAVEQGLALLGRGGTLVVLGMPASGVTAAFDPGELAHYGQRILGCKLGSIRPETDVPRLVQLYLQGRLKLDELISDRYPLEQINEAVVSATRGEALRNVIVFSAAP